MKSDFKHAIAFLALMFVCSVANAQLYKCTQNGQTTYADAPCGQSAAPVKTWSNGSAQNSSQLSPTGDGEKVCATDGVSALSLRDPESARVKVTGGRMVVIRWLDQPTTARSYILSVNAKNAYGGYTGEDNFFCYTSEDGRRLLFSGRRVLDIN